MTQKLTGGPASMTLKILLLILAMLIAAGTLFYTNDLVRQLQNKERQIVEVCAKGYEDLVSAPDNADLTYIWNTKNRTDSILNHSDFPMIVTSASDSIPADENPARKQEAFQNIRLNVRNLIIDTSKSIKEIRAYLFQQVQMMDKVHNPIQVKYKDSVIQKIHYGDSNLIKQLEYYPYIQIIIAIAFIIIGYIGFSQIKRSEQSNIWVGMAKETAHQFGTPLSSLMGWHELLKINYNDPVKVQDIADELNDDLQRMNKITNRFSKIGSKVELKPVRVADDIQRVIQYFTRRIPQTGRTVNISLKGDMHATAMLNSDLFEWVLENLVKNALDAIEHADGRIEFQIKLNGKKVEIDVTDNGKGVNLKQRKDIFRPGYSTKRRGWGLGLSLSKRIIDDYHNGRIYVKNSIIGQGTTFKIILSRADENS